ncbi:IclR family transcriptional regulator [Aestuariivita sp.]|jgi:DNA-binding IclR family transcriptional regulator|uniref:IclR family transcriptional regulator n=1 Tax=Aestuariivita sp. TaxID=1872407 RepID=UPI00216C19A1|nr:IclR family transcriptional regulator [Aestuariivita sp.]MCE8009529.1 IclR family transcriptional regulator [Aestuariivita sp.]
MANGNQSLSRGLAILSQVELSKEPLGVREIGRRLDISPTIVQRLIHTLVDEGFLIQEPTSQRYALGYRALSLGSSVRDENNLVATANAVLNDLADTATVNCYLAVIAAEQLVYVLTIQSPGPIAIKVQAGRVASFHSTAMGKALLASLPADRSKKLLSREPLTKKTDRTCVDPDDLISEIVEARQTGFALSRGENLVGVDSVAAVVRDSAGQPVAAISAAFAPSLQPDVNLAHLIRQVSDAARDISRELGCPEETLSTFHPVYEVSSDVA